MGLGKLQENIRQTLPEARLIETVIRLIPDIGLYLLDPFNLHRVFSADETRKIMINVPYWSFCWASGHALGAYIQREKKRVEGKRVLDFGSGSGIAAIASAKAGAEKVIAYDNDEHALEAVEANAELNHVTIETVRSLMDRPENIDILVVSDLLYDSDNLALLDRFFHYANEVLLADSRVKDFRHPRYQQIDFIEAETILDLNEAEEYNRVKIYDGL